MPSTSDSAATLVAKIVVIATSARLLHTQYSASAAIGSQCAIARGSGAFARAEPITRAEGGKIITQLLVPYVLFSAIWALVRWGYSGEPFVVDLASPYWHLWFLTALAAWRLALPVFAALACLAFVIVMSRTTSDV